MTSNKLPLYGCAKLIGLLAEGNTLRAASRLSGTPLSICTDLFADTAIALNAYQDRIIRNSPWSSIDIKAVWSFVYTTRKASSGSGGSYSYGDAWTWVATDAKSKFVLSWLVAGCDPEYATAYIADIRSRIGQYENLTIDEGFVSLKNGAEYKLIPASARFSSNGENVAERIGIRGFPSLTNAFSKKTKIYAHALTLHYMHYNFCRVEKSLGATPAMAAGLTGRLWSTSDLASVWEAWEGNRRSVAIRDQEQKQSRMESLKRAAELATTELDLETLLQSITDTGVSLTESQFGAFFENVICKRAGETYLLSLTGAQRESFLSFPMPRKTHLFDPIFRGTAVVRSGDITRDPHYGQNPPFRGMPKGHLPIKSYLAAPVISRSGAVLGGLFLGHSQARRFTSRHEVILAEIAAQAAIGIDNVHTFSRLKLNR